MKYANILDYYALLSRKINIPFYGTFELTPRCNMNCKMCYIRMSSEEMKKVGSELTIDEWIKLAKTAVDMGMLYILLTGGEPLLYKDFKKLYLYLYKMGVFISINSNATLINDDWIEFFSEYPPHQINITLYGGSNETYSRLCGNPKGYDQTTQAIKLLLKANIKVVINCVATKQNYNDIDKIFEFAKKHNITINANAYCFPPVRKEGIISPDLNRFDPYNAAKVRIMLNWYSIANKYKFCDRATRILSCPNYQDNLENSCVDEVGDKVLCAAGRSNFWVTWDGRMLPCGMIPDYSVSIKNIPFDIAWKKIVDYTATIHLPSECKNCTKKDICSPCAAKIKSETGFYDCKPQYLCDMTDEYILLLDKAKKFLENDE